MNDMQARLILLPGQLRVYRPGGIVALLSVFIVDHQPTGYGGGRSTIIMREQVPADISWGGSRLPGSIVTSDSEDVVVDLAAVEAGLLP